MGNTGRSLEWQGDRHDEYDLRFTTRFASSKESHDLISPRSQQDLGHLDIFRGGSPGMGPRPGTVHPVNKRMANKYAAISLDVPSAHHRIRINRLHEIVQLHIPMVSNFCKCGD